VSNENCRQIRVSRGLLGSMYFKALLKCGLSHYFAEGFNCNEKNSENKTFQKAKTSRINEICGRYLYIYYFFETKFLKISGKLKKDCFPFPFNPRAPKMIFEIKYIKCFQELASLAEIYRVSNTLFSLKV
jgi:hypothetical protein